MEKKHWLKEMVKLDMRAMAGDLKLLDQKIHRRKGNPYNEEEEHTIVVWILVRERLQSRKWSVRGKTFWFSIVRNPFCFLSIWNP